MAQNEERPATGETVEPGAVGSLDGEHTDNSQGEFSFKAAANHRPRASLRPHLDPEETASAIERLTAAGLRLLPLRPGSDNTYPGMALGLSETRTAAALELFSAHGEANIGVVLGVVSQAVVLRPTSVEGAGTLAAWDMTGRLPASWQHRDPAGLVHYWLRCPPECRWVSGEIAPGVELVAEGVVLAPPSVTPIGTSSWEHGPDQVALAAVPDWLVELAPARPPRTRPKSIHDDEDDEEAHAFDLRERAQRWARPYEYRPASAIPHRDWLYPFHLMRGIVTATVADSGVGKSTLLLGEALAVMSGYALLGVLPTHQARVWYWNGEDPDADFERRLNAAMLHHRLTYADIKGRLVIGSGYEDEMIVARGSGDIEVDLRAVDAIIARIRALNVGLVIIDPLKSSHLVSENDNTAMDRLIKAVWTRIAKETGCSVELVHHTRKTGGHDATVDDSRGAAALKGAVRSMRVVRQMSDNEAASFGIEGQDQPSYLRVEIGKSNMARTGLTSWFRLVNVLLENGDEVQAIEPWTPPDPFSEVTNGELRLVQKQIAAGRGEAAEGYRANVQAGDAWVGLVVAGVLKLDVGRRRERERINHLLKAWLDGGALRIVHRAKDAKGKTAPFVEVGNWAEA